MASTLLNMPGHVIRECMQVLFFFSSRRRHTRFDCDWSSDVCSSDLDTLVSVSLDMSLHRCHGIDDTIVQWIHPYAAVTLRVRCGARPIASRAIDSPPRSEERRVGKECRSRWSPYH